VVRKTRWENFEAVRHFARNSQKRQLPLTCQKQGGEFWQVEHFPQEPNPLLVSHPFLEPQPGVLEHVFPKLPPWFHDTMLITFADTNLPPIAHRNQPRLLE
jgi:hypothetical protein